MLRELHELFTGLTKQHYIVLRAQGRGDGDAPWLRIYGLSLWHSRVFLRQIIQDYEAELAGRRFPPLEEVDPRYQPRHIIMEDREWSNLMAGVEQHSMLEE